MCFGSVLKMGLRIASKTVRPALKQDELWFEFFNETLHSFECFQKCRISRSRRERYVEFGSLGPSLADLARKTSAWIEISPIFVYICNYDSLIAFVTVVDSVSVVGVDIHICNSLEFESFECPANCDSGIVENAESSSAISPCMVKPTYWIEEMINFSSYNFPSPHTLPLVASTPHRVKINIYPLTFLSISPPHAVVLRAEDGDAAAPP